MLEDREDFHWLFLKFSLKISDTKEIACVCMYVLVCIWMCDFTNTGFKK